MASTSAISQVPSDIIAYILSHLETIEDLSVVIQSHRIFLNAFNDGPSSIARAIVKSQVPSDAAPLLVAVLEASRVDHGAGIDTSREILNRFRRAISNPSQSQPTSFFLSKLSLSELAFCSRNYVTAESLAHKLAAEVKPIAIQKLDFGCSALPHLTSTEKTRLVRAFLRFQLLCYLFCPPASACPSSDDGDWKKRAHMNKMRFLCSYSPWVNDHLMCVFAWLQRILRQAFDELAWHDVDWGELPVDNDIEPEGNLRLQGFLSRGLGLLDEIARTDSYASRARLLRLDDCPLLDYERLPSQQFSHFFPSQLVVDSLGHLRLQDWTADQLGLLSEGGDGPRDSTGSSSCLVWLGANAGRNILGQRSDLQDMNDDTNLWQLSYNIWDWEFQDSTPSTSVVKKACREMRSMPPPFKPGMQYDDEAISRSQSQRSDIWLAGGRGYWPMGGAIDFGGIQGLSPEKMADLLHKWDINMDM